MAADETQIDLPAKVEDLAVAGSGSMLVMKLEGQKSLTVVDLITRKLRTIELETANFTFGAGGDVAIVFERDPMVVHSFDLKTGKEIRSKEFADPIQVLRVVMGPSWDGLAYLRTSRGVQDLDQTSALLIDVKTLSILKVPADKGNSPHGSSYRDMMHYRANGDLSRISSWATSHSPSGITLRVREGSQYVPSYNHDSAGYLAMGDDGRIYTGAGTIIDLVPPGQSRDPFNNALAAIDQFPGRSLIPGVGGGFYLGIKGDGTISVYQPGSRFPITDLDPLPTDVIAKAANAPSVPSPANQPGPGMNEPFAKDAMTFDRRVIFAPALGRIAFIPQSGRSVIVRDFELKTALDKTGKDYLIVLSSPKKQAKGGSEWTYQVVPLLKRNPAKYDLTSGPDGMTISPEGKLTWKVPRNIKGKASVTISVIDSAGAGVPQTFEIAID